MSSDPKLVAVAARADVFEIESDKRIAVLASLFMVIGLLLGFWFSTMQVIEVASDFFENLPTPVSATIVSVAPDKLKEEKKKEMEKPKTEKKQLKAPKMAAGPAASGPVNSGKGDIKERVTQKGLLAIISGKARAGSMAGAAVMTSSLAGDLDDVLQNIGGLKTAGAAGVGRMGLSGGKFNDGYAGSGGGAGGLDDLLGSLAGGSASGGNVGSLTKRATVELPTTKDFMSQGDGLAGRSPEEIYRVVMQHIGGLRAEYNKRLRDKPNLRGKVTIRFTIDPSGKVAKSEVVSSTMGDKLLEMSIASRVKAWRFDACGKCGMATVTYPFAFSQ
ncbi:MAG: TonB family protein [Fibrobacteres bacterium]|nr:TonB family protein [Fibrobacterota bacterium]